MLDGVHIIERIHVRGAPLNVLDKPYLDLTTPIGRGFIALLSAMAEDERTSDSASSSARTTHQRPRGGVPHLDGRAAARQHAPAG
jgi:DNA invertase Pin-like site-specific DNA recombinase